MASSSLRESMPHWYYRNTEGHPAGPYTDAEFKEYRESGTVRDTTPIWRNGWTEWTTFARTWESGEPPQTEASGEFHSPPPFPLRLTESIVETAPIKARFLECSLCKESWAEHLLFGTGNLRVCAKCLKAHEDRRKARERRRSRSNEFTSGIGSWIFKLTLAGLAFAGVIVLSLSLLKRGASESPKTKPTPSASSK